jgi:hypothetical protein
METATRGTIRTIGGQLAVIVGVVHLGLGLYAAVGGSGVAASDPRVAIWSVAGAVLVGGVALAAVGWHHRQLYVLGLVVTGSLVAAYLLWPALAGTSFYLGSGVAAPPLTPLGYVHGLVLGAPPLAKIALATEAALLAVLLVLLSSPEPR